MKTHEKERKSLRPRKASRKVMIERPPQRGSWRHTTIQNVMTKCNTGCRRVTFVSDSFVTATKLKEMQGMPVKRI